jgi:hypothetical protein
MEDVGLVLVVSGLLKTGWPRKTLNQPSFSPHQSFFTSPYLGVPHLVKLSATSPYTFSKHSVQPALSAKRKADLNKKLKEAGKPEIT